MWPGRLAIALFEHCLRRRRVRLGLARRFDHGWTKDTASGCLHGSATLNRAAPLSKYWSRQHSPLITSGSVTSHFRRNQIRAVLPHYGTITAHLLRRMIQYPISNRVEMGLFGRLPRELRDQIYDLVLAGVRKRPPWSISLSTAISPDAVPTVDIKPSIALLGICRQIRVEATSAQDRHVSVVWILATLRERFAALVRANARPVGESSSYFSTPESFLSLGSRNEVICTNTMRGQPRWRIVNSIVPYRRPVEDYPLRLDLNNLVQELHHDNLEEVSARMSIESHSGHDWVHVRFQCGKTIRK